MPRQPLLRAGRRLLAAASIPPPSVAHAASAALTIAMASFSIRSPFSCPSATVTGAFESGQ